jgi:lipopolysaccharide heptosyltransferase II
MRQHPRLLIVKLSALGDIIHTIPVVAGLKKACPQAFIGWVVSRPYEEILSGNPHIDQVFLFERKRWGGVANFWRHRGEFARLIRQIRSTHFDVVLDFQGLLRSAVLTLLSGAPRRIGFANAREFAPLAYTETLILPPKPIHALERYVLLANRLAEIDVPAEFPMPLSQECYERIARSASDLLPDADSKVLRASSGLRMVVMVPGTRWVTKQWPPQYFARLADMLWEKYHPHIFLAGAPSDFPIGEEILRVAKPDTQIESWIGQTSLKELVTLMSQADLVVTNDSGPMHIAAAVGTQILALFGPTDPVLTGPYGSRHIVLKASLPCVPCMKRYCTNAVFCLFTITPEEVLQEIERSWHV